VSRRRPGLPAAVPLLALALVSCGANVLAAATVADGAEDALEAEVGARPDVSCPEDLEAEVRAETRCTLSVGDDPDQYGVTVAVTSIDGDTADLDVQVDDEPAG
jgi:Domain of unknown function (DUF4333)